MQKFYSSQMPAGGMPDMPDMPSGGIPEEPNVEDLD